MMLLGSSKRISVTDIRSIPPKRPGVSLQICLQMGSKCSIQSTISELLSSTRLNEEIHVLFEKIK